MAHVEPLLHDLAGRAKGIGGIEQGAGVTGGQFVPVQHFLDRLGQAQKAHHVGDVAAAFTDGLRQNLLGMGKLIDQALIPIGFLQRRKVLALEVFHQSDLQGLLVTELADDDRDLMHLGHLGRPPAAFSGDNFIGVIQIRMAADQQRLENPVLAHRLGQFLDLFLVDGMARLVTARVEALHGNLAGALKALFAHGYLTCFAEKGIEAAAQVLAFLFRHHAARRRSR